jgi:hypothetical protein
MKPAKVQTHDPEDENLPPDLLALKRGLAAEGIGVQLPTPGATWKEFDPPLQLEGITLSEMVIRLRRGGEL